MAQINSRDGLKEYCLRRLGHPVIEINVDDGQIEDRIDDALQYWHEYHFDGLERLYMKAEITGSTLTFVDPVVSNFLSDEIIVGETSGAKAQFYKVESDTKAMIYRVEGTFVEGEAVTGETTGTTGVLAATDAFFLGNWDSQFIEMADPVTSVVRVLKIGMGGLNNTTNNMFDIVYQFRMSDLYNLFSTDMIYYAQVKQHLSLLDMLLTGERTIRFNRKQNRLFIECHWYTTFVPGDFIVAEVYRALDPEEFNEVYDDMFMKKYATALIKRQWGENLKKFGGLQLPGGVTLNGETIYNEAVNEILQLENEMITTHSLPVDFFIG